MVVEESQTLIFNLLGDLHQNYWEKKKGKKKVFFFFLKKNFEKGEKSNWVTKKKFFIKTKIK